MGYEGLQFGPGTSELIFIGFLLFIIIYILVRLLTERLEHSKDRPKVKRKPR